jgi:hypothetical protein
MFGANIPDFYAGTGVSMQASVAPDSLFQLFIAEDTWFEIYSDGSLDWNLDLFDLGVGVPVNIIDNKFELLANHVYRVDDWSISIESTGSFEW